MSAITGLCDAWSDRKLLRIRAFQIETKTGSRRIRLQLAFDGLHDAVENHSLDADVIVKIFGVAHCRRCATDVNVQRGRAVRRERNVMRLSRVLLLEETP